MNTVGAKIINPLCTAKGVILIACVINGLAVDSANAGWKDFLNDLESNVKSTNNSQLSSGDIAQGLKEALKVGAKKSIDGLGKANGFYKDKAVKIRMPKKLKKVEKLLRKTGQKKLADKFVKTMNRAAEESVKSTFTIFVGAIKKMTLKDAVNIYNGRNDEATRYFKKTSGVEIQKTIHPIVKKATEETGVTYNYKKIAKKIRKLHPALSENMPDIDNYVTEKTMDGIFYKIAKEEALIRKDPAARTTDILKKVFGQ